MTRQLIADRVKAAFFDLGIVKSHSQSSKYDEHYNTIANYLLSSPGTDEYKFIVELVGVLKARGCTFVTPAVCSNRKRMEEALKQMSKPQPLAPENMLEGCRKRVKTCMDNGVCKTVKNALVSPVTSLPAWFRILESGFDEEVVEYYGYEAKEELAKDPALAKYIRKQVPDWDDRSEKWS